LLLRDSGVPLARSAENEVLVKKKTKVKATSLNFNIVFPAVIEVYAF
jgi:hypothetical protein